MTKVWLLMLAANAPLLGGSITYEYLGQPLSCSYGACPANITSDYITASLTFAAPPAVATVNYLNTKFSPNLLS